MTLAALLAAVCVDIVRVFAVDGGQVRCSAGMVSEHPEVMFECSSSGVLAAILAGSLTMELLMSGEMDRFFSGKGKSTGRNLSCKARNSERDTLQALFHHDGWVARFFDGHPPQVKLEKLVAQMFPVPQSLKDADFNDAFQE